MRRSSLAFIACSLWVGANAQNNTLEEIIVTGTRISRSDFVSASPIVTVPADAFAGTSSPTVETTLNQMPQFVPGLTSTSNLVADGQSTADLRGLGASRTLVLVDGRRLIPANGEGVPDLNVIPPALIERVEIVTGGASATYGSDAIAGVVNLKLRRSMDGLQFGSRWGQTSRGDADEYDVSITAGTPIADGRGSVMGFVGYANRSQLNQSARDFSRASLFYVGPGAGVTGPGQAYVPGGSSNIEEGAALVLLPSIAAFADVFAGYGYAEGTVPLQRRFGVNEDGTLFTTGNFEPGSVANFRGVRDPLLFSDFFYGYNAAATNALQMPLERVSGFLAANFDLGESAELYGQAILADYSVNSQAAPAPLQDVLMPVTNPYVPADLATLLASREGAEEEPFPFLKRMTALGPRVQENQYDTVQLTAGLRGRVLGDWDYDAYVQFGESDQTKHQTGNVLRSKVMELTFAPDGGASICGGFNPFGLKALGPDCAMYVATDARNHATVRETIVEASMDGPVVDLPAGVLRAAVGLMYRDQSYRYRADENLRRVLPDGGPDVIGLGAADNMEGDDNNFDTYVEVLVPVLGERPGVELLEVGLGYRYSDYASAGGVDAWKTELMYEPVDVVRLRGSYQRAVRAPSIFELYQPRIRGFGDMFKGEPCSVGSPQRDGPYGIQVEALCVAQGVPESQLPTFFDEEIPLVSGGNPDLGPEQATTYTAGVVLQPDFESLLLDDLQLAIDWYRIDMRDSAQYVGATDAVVNCYDPAFNPELRVENFWCSTFGRDPATGEIAQSVGTYLNLASQSTSGIDAQLQSSFPAGPGRLSVSWLISWIASFEVQSAPGAPTDEYAGTVGGFAGSYPEWKWNLHLGYTVGGLTLGAGWRYIASMADGGRYGPDVELERFDVRVPSYDYIDLDASYEVRSGPFDGLVLRVGIENLANKDPPLFPSSPVANTDPSQYDVLGRRYFVGMEYRL